MRMYSNGVGRALRGRINTGSAGPKIIRSCSGDRSITRKSFATLILLCFFLLPNTNKMKTILLALCFCVAVSTGVLLKRKPFHRLIPRDKLRGKSIKKHFKDDYIS